MFSVSALNKEEGRLRTGESGWERDWDVRGTGIKDGLRYRRDWDKRGTAI